jgi:hypothetical protein
MWRVHQNAGKGVHPIHQSGRQTASGDPYARARPSCVPCPRFELLAVVQETHTTYDRLASQLVEKSFALGVQDVAAASNIALPAASLSCLNMGRTELSGEEMEEALRIAPERRRLYERGGPRPLWWSRSATSGCLTAVKVD